MDGPDAEFVTKLSEKLGILRRENEKLKAYILNTCSLHRDGMKCGECARLGCGIYEIVKGNANA